MPVHQLNSSPNNLPSDDVMFKALVEKDREFEGVFIAAIKTTGIFCRSSCHARKPKRKNVVFYASCKEALSFGYRPCKVCNPLEPLDNTPKWIVSLLEEVSNIDSPRLTDEDIRQRGIEPARLRRWFKKNHGVTFQAYLRALRLNQAIGSITVNQPVTQAALEAGYESLSGFGEAFKNLLGVSPKQVQAQNIVTVNRLLTPLGPMIAGVSNKGLCLLEFYDRRMLETQFKRLAQRINANFIVGESALLDSVSEQLKLYFSGQLTQFDLPIDLQGTDFQIKTWQALITIPYGHTRSYQQQAIQIGDEKAVRAVAKANGDNRLAIVIPCHRVIGKNGKLTGYGGGLWRKQRLLALEQDYKN